MIGDKTYQSEIWVLKHEIGKNEVIEFSKVDVLDPSYSDCKSFKYIRKKTEFYESSDHP